MGEQLNFEYINELVRFIMVIGSMLIFAYLVIGAVTWISSGGDKGKTERARTSITTALIGLGILAIAYSLFTFFAGPIR